MEQKPYVIQVDGGIGRVICSVPAIEKLAKTTQRKVIVITSYPDVFLKNPNVHKVYNLNREYLWDDVIRHGEFLYPEPYFNHLYYDQQHHLMQNFNFLIHGEAGKVERANIYLTEEEKAWALGFVADRKKEFKKKIVLLQCFGSSARLEENRVIDPTHRSLNMTKVDQICKETNHLYINVSHIPLNYSNVWQQDFTLRQLFALTSCCDFIVGIDSAVMHIGASFNKSGVIFFGSTYQANLSYPCFTNIQRKGYPKNYAPNRFSGFVDSNERALDFTEDEMVEIVKEVDCFFPARL